MAPGGSNKPLRYAEAAEYLNISESTLRQNWRRYGLRAHRIGRTIQFRERELERWIESRAEQYDLAA
jgi:excisionase family DNA binding protein